MRSITLFFRACSVHAPKFSSYARGALVRAEAAVSERCSRSGKSAGFREKRQTANLSREISSDVWSGTRETLLEPLMPSMASCSRKLLLFSPEFSTAFCTYLLYVLYRVQLNNAAMLLPCTWSISRLGNRANVPFFPKNSRYHRYVLSWPLPVNGFTGDFTG